MAAVLDVNHDGLVSATEHAAIARARFARMDTNGDGFVSSQEWTAAHSRQAAKTP
jgi:Ca2+-binding EF-hand superfamily protein